MFIFFAKYLSTLASPLMIPAELLLIGIVLLLFTRRQTGGKVFVILGFLLLCFVGFRDTADMLMRPLEQKYPPVLAGFTEGLLPQEFSGIKYIVVLGGGHYSDVNLPVTSESSPTALVRLIEGIRLQKLITGSRLVLSGGSVYDTTSDAEMMEHVAVSLGVDRQDILLERESKDTEDEARLLQPLLGKQRFILVTSAVHMPRSMKLLMKRGMRPIPAPTDYMVHPAESIRPSSFFLMPESLEKADRAVHEYIGELWSFLRGEA